MAWHRNTNDLDANEDDDFVEQDDDDQSDCISCPSCRRQIYEDAERCPYCQQYVTREGAQRTNQPLWVVITAIVCLIVVLIWAFPLLFLSLLGF